MSRDAQNVCAITIVGTVLKAKICCELLHATLTASCLIILAGDVSKYPGPVSDLMASVRRVAEETRRP